MMLFLFNVQLRNKYDDDDIPEVSAVYQQSAMQMNRCRHLVPLYPYHATNYSYYNLIIFNCVL